MNSCGALHRHCKRSLLIRSLLFWLPLLCVFPFVFSVCLAQNAWAQSDQVGGQQVVGRELLEAKLREVEASTDQDKVTRDLLTDLYLKSIGNLDAHGEQLKAAQEYADSIVNDPAAAEALNTETKRLRYRPYQPRLNIDRNDETAKIAQELLKLRAALSDGETDVTRMLLAVEDGQKRLVEAREELVAANNSQGSQSESDVVEQGEDNQAVKQARAWYRETSLLALSSRIKMLDQELLSHTPRLQLLDAQIGRREVTIEHLKQDIAAIESLLGERRQVEADEAIARAHQAQLEAEGKNPLLIGVATENALISSRLLTQANAIERESVRAAAVDEQAKALEESFRVIRQKLQVAGMNRALGRILQDQRNSLPNARALKSELRGNAALISDITLEQLIIEERRKELRRPADFAQDMIEEAREGWIITLDQSLDVTRVPAAGAALADPDSADKRHDSKGNNGGSVSSADHATPAPLSEKEVLSELTQLLRNRVDLLTKLGAINSSYLQALSDLEFAQRRLVNVVKEYDAYLSERLLWVRSVSHPKFGDLLSFSGEVLVHFDGPEWRRVGWKILEPNAYSPVLMIGLLVATLLYLSRRRLRKALLQTNRYLGNPVKDNFGSTLRSLLISMLLCVPGPLILLSLCFKLWVTPGDAPLHQALIPGLLWLSTNWFVFRVFYQICCPEGLAHRHFRWHVPALRPIRREVLLLMVIFLPIGFLSLVSSELDSSALEWSGVRVLLALTMLTFAGFFLRVLRRNGPVMQSLMFSKAGVLLVRLRWLWLTLSVIIPVILVGLTIVGYVYTAAKLMSSFVMSFWVLIDIVLVHQLCVRWLNMTESKLHYRALQEEQKKQLQEDIDGDGGTTQGFGLGIEEPLHNLALLGRDSQKLVNILCGFVALFGYMLVWSDLLPALGYLNNIQLWDSVSSKVAGETVLRPITLADFGLSVLIVSVTVFLYRTLPSMLELVLSQVFTMAHGARYTVITLTRYALLTCGVFVVASLLGFEWAKFQWLVAALGVGIGFGLQEIVANFISGLILLFERPIRVGDRVTVGEIEGNVSRIQARATTIQTWDRQELLVPNKEFITGPLLNWSLSDRVSRLVVNVGIAYGSDVTRALDIVHRVAREEEKVLDEPAPFVTLESFGDNSLNLRLRCFMDDMEARLETNSRLNEAINREFERAGIVISFPQVDVHFDAEQPLHVRLQRGRGRS